MSEYQSRCSPRIVQLLMTPQDATWQNRLIGLGSDGVTYSVSHKGFWEPFVPPLGVKENMVETKSEYQFKLVRDPWGYASAVTVGGLCVLHLQAGTVRNESMAQWIVDRLNGGTDAMPPIDKEAAG